MRHTEPTGTIIVGLRGSRNQNDIAPLSHWSDRSRNTLSELGQVSSWLAAPRETVSDPRSDELVSRLRLVHAWVAGGSDDRVGAMALAS